MSTAEEHTRLANRYWFEEGKMDDAIREYKEALRIDPDYAPARSNLGSLYLRQDKIEDAIAEFEQALRRGVSSALIRRNTKSWLEQAISIRDERQRPIGDVDKAVQEYIEELGGPCNRLPAVYEQLARIGKPAVEALIIAIRSDNSILRNRAMELLGEIADPRAVEPLSEASKITEGEFRAITGIQGPSTTVDLSGMKVEVRFSNLLSAYRKNAEKALDKIKQANTP